MADNSGWSDYFDELFDPDPADYRDILFGNDRDVDQHALELFSEWMGSGFKDDGILNELDRYMWEEYGIDFNEVFEWQDFKEWYDSQ